ncbi:MAG: DUF6602 domain-containing protein [Planctomycetota bacterium]
MDWDGLFKSTSSSMRTEFEKARTAVTNSGLKGNINERIVAEFLRQVLPARIGFCTGEVIDSEGGHSKQIDVLAYDAISATSVFKSGEIQVLPIESVFAVVEVKAVLNKQEIEKAFQNMLAIKNLEKKAYLPNLLRDASNKSLYGMSSQIWPVQFFVFAFESDSLETVCGHVAALNATQPLHKRIDSVCVLDKGLVTNVSSRGLDAIPMPDTHLIAKPTDKALLAFYAQLSTLLSQTDTQPFNVNEYLKHISF